jgi:hypothetical protein
MADARAALPYRFAADARAALPYRFAADARAALPDLRVHAYAW